MGRSQGLGVETQSHWLGHTGLRSRQTGCPGQLAPQESMHFWKKKRFLLQFVLSNPKYQEERHTRSARGSLEAGQ